MPVKAFERLLSKIEVMNTEIFVAEKRLRTVQEYWNLVRHILDEINDDLDLPTDKKEEALRMRADMEDQLGLLRANLARLLDVRLALETFYNEQTEALYRSPSLIYLRPHHH
jgi:hypothetical protein